MFSVECQEHTKFDVFVIFTHKNGCHSLYKKVSSELSTALHKQFSRKKKKTKKIVEIPSKQSKQNDDNVVIAGTLHFIAVVVVE